MGSYATAGQLQQRPVPDGGGVFKQEWIHFWKPEELPEVFDSIIMSWDMAFKQTATSDFDSPAMQPARKTGSAFSIDFSTAET